MKYLVFICMLPNILSIYTCNTLFNNEHLGNDLFDLQYLIRPQQDVNTKAPILILLHGYGSNEADLFHLAKNIPENWIVVSVRAPLAIGNNQFKWYTVNMVNDEIIINFAEEEQSRKSILKLINELLARYNVDSRRIVTAGFSQGSNMSLSLILTKPEKILAAGCFSGRFIKEIKSLVNNTNTLKSKQVFMSLGNQDTMLPLLYAEESRNILQQWGINVELNTDNVGHTISDKHLSAFTAWLQRLQ